MESDLSEATAEAQLAMLWYEFQKRVSELGATVQGEKGGNIRAVWVPDKDGPVVLVVEE
jgi:hypothetical protein